MSRNQAVVLRVFAIWTIWVWGTRIWNVFDDDNSTGFVIVHVSLAVVSVILAVAALVVVSQARRRSGTDPTAAPARPGVEAFAEATVGTNGGTAAAATGAATPTPPARPAKNAAKMTTTQLDLGANRRRAREAEMYLRNQGYRVSDLIREKRGADGGETYSVLVVDADIDEAEAALEGFTGTPG